MKVDGTQYFPKRTSQHYTLEVRKYKLGSETIFTHKLLVNFTNNYKEMAKRSMWTQPVVQFILNKVQFFFFQFWP